MRHYRIRTEERRCCVCDLRESRTQDFWAHEQQCIEQAEARAEVARRLAKERNDEQRQNAVSTHRISQ